jgi:hypothetical protein
VTVECFRRRRFREASLSLIEALSEIASEYLAVGLRLTVRQLYYQCVARVLIENNEREYQKIIRLLTDAREAGFFDWDAIEDRGREVVMCPCWTSPTEILEAAQAPTMRIDGSFRTCGWSLSWKSLPWLGSSSLTITFSCLLCRPGSSD